MDEPFEIPVVYKDKELHFPARLLLTGYTHKFSVDVNGQEVLFEPDEEGAYRALVDTEGPEPHQKTDAALLRAIADAIRAILE